MMGYDMFGADSDDGTNQQKALPATTMSILPSPLHQTWIHAVDNQQTWYDALYDDTITAIETDLVMGTTTVEATATTATATKKTVTTTTTTTSSQTHQNVVAIEPIMAHPPCTTSD